MQFFTWLGLFRMWLHFSNAVPVVCASSDQHSPLFKSGAEWAGVCYGLKGAVTFLAAFKLMAAARKLDRRLSHSVGLALGAVDLHSLGLLHGEQQKNWLLLALALGGGGVLLIFHFTFSTFVNAAIDAASGRIQRNN